MIWLTWRHVRSQAAAVYAAVGGMVVVLALTGPRLVELARVHPDVLDRLTRTDERLFNAGILVLAVVPALLGVFWGAPLVARELEAGTHRLVWNQSVTRTRWLVTKIAATVLLTVIAVGMLTLAVTWWSSPIDATPGTGRGSLPSRVTPVAFAMRGVVPVAYAVFAVLLGVALGIVVRRTVVAMALTLAIFTALQLAVPAWIRPHLATPARGRVEFSESRLDGIRADPTGATIEISMRPDPGAWLLSRTTVDGAGRTVGLPSWVGDCLPAPPGAPAAGRSSAAAPDLRPCLERLAAEGYRQQLVFHPVAHFWRLQWAETALYLALSALLAALSVWWTRHRLS